jgi:hypothetical protein
MVSGIGSEDRTEARDKDNGCHDDAGSDFSKGSLDNRLDCATSLGFLQVPRDKMDRIVDCDSQADRKATYTNDF